MVTIQHCYHCYHYYQFGIQFSFHLINLCLFYPYSPLSIISTYSTLCVQTTLSHYHHTQLRVSFNYTFILYSFTYCLL